MEETNHRKEHQDHVGLNIGPITGVNLNEVVGRATWFLRRVFMRDLNGEAVWRRQCGIYHAS
jgi:hypothetical protein